MKCEADFEYPIDMKRKRGRHMEAEEKVLNIRISVRDLVEFVLRSGDIDNRKGGGLGEKEAMQEGSRIPVSYTHLLGVLCGKRQRRGDHGGHGEENFPGAAAKDK